MAVKYATVSVGTTATSLLGGVSDESGPTNTRSVLLTNKGASSVYVGGADVTASASGGYELAAGAEVALDLSRGDVPYGRVASGTVDVGVLHTGV